MHGRRLLSLLMTLSGCTAVNYTALPAQRAMGQIFMTAEGLSGPYESVGIVQVTRRGALAFGFADPAGTDLAAAVAEVEDQVRRAGADGLINTRIEQTSHTTAERIFGLIFFFAPIPSEVTVTGELVRVRPAQPVPALPRTPAPGGIPL
jgi:hypothetical protein